MTKRVLFVCMGNICRSPTAHAVFQKLVDDLSLDIEIDSAGTIGFHRNSPSDSRSRAAGESRGYDFSGIHSRQVEIKDFQYFDLILAMDKQNLTDLQSICPQQHREKLKLMLDYGSSAFSEVPDPYYGGDNGFELVLDLIEESCHALLLDPKLQ